MNLGSVCTRIGRKSTGGRGLTEDVMAVTPLMLLENTGVDEAIACMSQMGVRRALVVNDTGGLCGIVSMDDLLPIVGEPIAGSRAFLPAAAGESAEVCGGV